MNELMKKETQEAVNAGNQALRSLYAAREKLSSAREQVQDAIDYVEPIVEQLRNRLEDGQV